MLAAPVAKNVPSDAVVMSAPTIGMGINVAKDLAEEYGHGPAKDWAHKKLMKNQALRFLRPQWYIDKHRHNASYVRDLDIDLAMHKSMSLAAKIAFQKERNFQQRMSPERDNWLQWKIAAAMDNMDDDE